MIALPKFRFELIDIIQGRFRAQYKQLHNLLFVHTAISDQWLDWYHNMIGSLNSRLVGTRTYGIFTHDQLVGIWSVEPKSLTDESGSVIDVGRCFSVGIHPNYRRQGLFVSLSEFAIEQERRLAQYDYILGFPQLGRPVVGGHLRAGWESIQNIELYSFNSETLINITPRSKALWISDFGKYDVYSDLHGSFFESPSYRNQRWLLHPDNQYICLAYKQSYIVMKPYGSLCHILDIRGESQCVSILLEIAKTLARRHRWNEVNIWCASNDIYHQEILDAGFSEGSDISPPVVLIAVRIKATTHLSLTSGTHFQMGVEETY